MASKKLCSCVCVLCAKTLFSNFRFFTFAHTLWAKFVPKWIFILRVRPKWRWIKHFPAIVMFVITTNGFVTAFSDKAQNSSCLIWLNLVSTVKWIDWSWLFWSQKSCMQRNVWNWIGKKCHVEKYGHVYTTLWIAIVSTLNFMIWWARTVKSQKNIICYNMWDFFWNTK